MTDIMIISDTMQYILLYYVCI